LRNQLKCNKKKLRKIKFIKVADSGHCFNEDGEIEGARGAPTDRAEYWRGSPWNIVSLEVDGCYNLPESIVGINEAKPLEFTTWAWGEPSREKGSIVEN
jgi:hypothetical protein